MTTPQLATLRGRLRAGPLCWRRRLVVRTSLLAKPDDKRQACAAGHCGRLTASEWSELEILLQDAVAGQVGKLLQDAC